MLTVAFDRTAESQTGAWNVLLNAHAELLSDKMQVLSFLFSYGIPKTPPAMVLAFRTASDISSTYQI